MVDIDAVLFGDAVALLGLRVLRLGGGFRLLGCGLEIGGGGVALLRSDGKGGVGDGGAEQKR